MMVRGGSGSQNEEDLWILGSPRTIVNNLKLSSVSGLFLVFSDIFFFIFSILSLIFSIYLDPIFSLYSI
jgi:hypothetical protein